MSPVDLSLLLSLLARLLIRYESLLGWARSLWISECLTWSLLCPRRFSHQGDFSFFNLWISSKHWRWLHPSQTVFILTSLSCSRVPHNLKPTTWLSHNVLVLIECFLWIVIHLRWSQLCHLSIFIGFLKFSWRPNTWREILSTTVVLDDLI